VGFGWEVKAEANEETEGLSPLSLFLYREVGPSAERTTSFGALI